MKFEILGEFWGFWGDLGRENWDFHGDFEGNFWGFDGEKKLRFREEFLRVFGGGKIGDLGAEFRDLRGIFFGENFCVFRRKTGGFVGGFWEKFRGFFRSFRSITRKKSRAE